jgi:hypothetical protein
MHLALNILENKGLDDLRGYGSIQWFDSDIPEVIRLCKLEGGELSVAAIMDGKTTVGVVWSSSKSHLNEALNAAGVKAEEFDIKTGIVYNVKGGNLWDSDDKLSLGSRLNVEMGITWEQGRRLVRPYGEIGGFSSDNLPKVNDSSAHTSERYTTTPSNWRDNRRLLRGGEFPSESRKGATEVSTGSWDGEEKVQETVPQLQDSEIIQLWLAEKRARIQAEDFSELRGNTTGAHLKHSSSLDDSETIDIPQDLVGKLANPLAIYQGQDIEYVDELGFWVGYEQGQWVAMHDNGEIVYRY